MSLPEERQSRLKVNQNERGAYFFTQLLQGDSKHFHQETLIIV